MILIDFVALVAVPILTAYGAYRITIKLVDRAIGAIGHLTRWESS